MKKTLALPLLVLAACTFKSKEKLPGEERPLKVVSSVGMVGEAVGELCASLCDHSQLITTGLDPHIYQPTSGDIEKIQAADITFFLGLGFEGKLSHILEDHKKAYGLGKKLAADRLIKVGPDTFDPHVWLDVGLWTQIIPEIERVLSEARPAQRMEIHNRATELKRQWVQLDAWVREQVATLEEAKRVLVTSHNSFQYFAAAYKFKVLALQGISTQSEASLSDVVRITDFVKTHRVPFIFAEATISRQGMQKVAEGSGAKLVEGDLYTDSFGPQGGPAENYGALIRHNVSLIVEHLKKGGTPR